MPIPLIVGFLALIGFGVKCITAPLLVLIGLGAKGVIASLLGLLGFGAQGVIAGSMAATFQSIFYGASVPAGGLFALFTSTAMTA